MSTPIKVFIEDAQEPTAIRNADIAAALGIKDGDRLDRNQSAALLKALRDEIRICRRRSAGRALRRLLNSTRRGTK